MALVAVVSAAGTAAADKPSWCPKGYGDDLNGLSALDSNDVMDQIKTAAKAMCQPDRLAKPESKAKVDAAVDRLGKAYGLQGSDWADILQYEQDHSQFMMPTIRKGDYSSKNLAEVSPLEQFSTVTPYGDLHGTPIYHADMFGSHLSELGRLAFVGWCLSKMNDNDDTTVTIAAICQEDFDKFNPAKAFDEIRADTHGGVVKMWLRVAVHDAVAGIANAPSLVAHFVKKDDEYKRVADVAAAGRTEWEKTTGTRTDLLELALKTESAYAFGSRKMAEGCEQATAKAVQDIVAKTPAKVFKGAHDTNEGTGRSFGEVAADVFITNKELYLAGVAYFECRPDSGTGHFFEGVFGPIAGFRGPRTAAWTALAGETFKFDDTSKQGLSLPNVGDAQGPFGRYSRAPHTIGGVVKALKPDGKDVEVDFDQSTYKEEGCVQQHNGNHILRVLSNGTVQYNIICDKYGMRTYAVGAYQGSVTKDSAKLLKPGIMFSSYAGVRNAGEKLPSMVLGAHLK